uniref:Uncharacterized protein n=1 Tax=Avena sativa TaxID=4498 RepID=A0ACD5VF71_AVESA
MADRPGGSLPRPARPRSGLATAESFHHRVQPHAPASSNAQFLVSLALAVSLAALLFLATVTLTVGLVALVAISPLLFITSPLWAPLAVVAIVAGCALLFAYGLAVFALGTGTWAHRHLTGRHPVGTHLVGYADDARGRTGQFMGAGSHGTSHYVQGYGRTKDAAPGA